MGIRGVTPDYLIFEDLVFKSRPEKQEGATIQRPSYCEGPPPEASQAHRKKDEGMGGWSWEEGMESERTRISQLGQLEKRTTT